MTTITSSIGETTFGSNHPTVLASMLINTLKDESLARKLISGDLDEVKRLAENQSEDGTGLLQIMVAHPEIDEEIMLPKVCKAVHDAVGLPLYIDSTNIAAIRRTLDVFPYKPLLSLSADASRMTPTLELVKESKAAVICLCMDDQGIPNNVAGRLSIADNLIQKARELNIPEDDLVIDPIVMSVGVSDPDSMQITLELLRQIKQQFNYATFLGIDNAGFGMPHKDTIDLAYLLAAIPQGLDVALLDPPLCSTVGRLGLNLLFASNFLSGRDPYAKKYLAYMRKNNLIVKRRRNG